MRTFIAVVALMLTAAFAEAASLGTAIVIQDRTVHGVNGMINLYGIESPGLTSSLAIGRYVAALVANDM